MKSYNVKQNTKIKKSKKAMKLPAKLLAVILVILCLLSYGTYRIVARRDAPATETIPMTEENQDIDFSPATEEDKADVDQHKADLGSTDNENQPNGNLKTVTPIIVGSNNSSPVAVRSYVSGVVENGGTCTLTLTKNSESVSASGTATAGAQTTDCPELSASVPSTGTWQASIYYKSSTAEGTSAQDWTINIE